MSREQWWNDNYRGNRYSWKKVCSSTILSTTDPTQNCLKSKLRFISVEDKSVSLKLTSAKSGLYVNCEYNYFIKVTINLYFLLAALHGLK
jgi:hypothetical protein